MDTHLEFYLLSVTVPAQMLRHLLVDHARLHNAQKHRGTPMMATLCEKKSGLAVINEELLSVHEALSEFEQLDSRAARVVELKFFGGLNEQEIAQVLDVSKITVQRDWRAARAWLMSRLAPAADRPR
ncbi:MAG: hypothetical protein JO185_11835 [Acidobacteriaceae bacterium]|nr:hypothetical protein [Acidobacteriaceae bacterium]